ncbi:MAG TPA: ATP-binding cassette domain-containing protein [Thermoanaerobaculia bacterium]|nr:ATP-binding cassette domain-containing protein [Thermoanaerobaculia bacterium]
MPADAKPAGAGVRFEDVTVALDGRPVLRDASLEIRPGERTAFVGPNGGGKTTLVRTLLGILRPRRGRVVFLDGRGAEIPRPRIGFLSQRSTVAFDAPLSALDLVAFSLSPEAGFRNRSRASEEARAALLRVGLPADRVGAPVGRLSGGQRQRVLLARAVAGAPPLLVLDEADTALDAEGLATLRRLVSEETAAGRTVVYVTHDSDAMGGADAVFRVDGAVTEEPVDA